jgi:uncharacterized protein (TIGR03382 family)
LLGLSGSVAHAHIHLLKPLSRTDDPQGDPQKEQHCGNPLQTRNAARVATFHPGETITVEWKETIEHTGWFRIAFQPSGEVFGIPPASNGPNGAGATGNFPTEDRTGMTDPVNGSIVLMDRIADGAVNVVRTASVTLPNMECANCTLQVIQLMNNAGNAPYTIDTASNDIYFQCADITLAANAPDAGVTATEPDAGTDPGNPGGTDPGKVSGGCQAGGGTGAPVALVLLGLVGLRRRRRR